MKYMLITGASSGIGFETFSKCFRNNIYPIAVIRNYEKFKNNLISQHLQNNKFSIIDCDLEDISAIENIVKEVSGKTIFLQRRANTIFNLPGINQRRQQ